MLVRDATLDDVQAIAGIYAHHVLHGAGSFEEEPPALDTMIARYRAVVDRGLPWLVAEIDGEIAGYSYARPYHERSAYRFTLEDAVYIAPGRVRGGIGRALVDRGARALRGGRLPADDRHHWRHAEPRLHRPPPLHGLPTCRHA